MPGQPYVQRPRPPRRTLVLTSLQALGSVVGTVALYYLLPLDGRFSASSGVALGVLLLAFIALGTVQVRSIAQSSYPMVRATVVLAALVPLFVVAFAGYYYVVEQQDPTSFTGALTRTDALYFTVTVLATVGFGDIVPTTESARIAVTVQMVADLAVLGVLIRTTSRAVSRGWEDRRPGVDGASPAAGDAADRVPAKDR